MAAIDPLLGIVDMRSAIGLVLATGEVPSLLPPGPRATLSMPALSVAMFDHLLNELFTPEQRAALLEHGTFEHVYDSAPHGRYAIHASASGDKISVSLTKVAGAASSSDTARTATIVSAAAPPLQRAESAPLRLPEVASIASAATPLSREKTAQYDSVLDQAVERRASDVLFSAGESPFLRVDGELTECHGAAPTPAADIEAYFLPRMAIASQSAYANAGSVDFAFSHQSPFGGEPVRFRTNLFRHNGGAAAALRPIASQIPTLADLGLPATLSQLVDQRHGLLLFTGATGSGKSTTLAALLEHINRTRSAHIVTLEDPIEFAYTRRRAVIHQRELGIHVDSFASGLRAALRENPDVLLVGEMRDPETIRMALTAAQTGHLVLTTLHSGGAIMAIDRVIDGFPESEKTHVRHELAATLRHVVAQRLVPAIAGGRVPALEILSVNYAIAAQIREGRTHMVATQLETGAEEGMVPMPRALAQLVRSGRVTRAAALGACEDRAALEALLEERPAGRTQSRSS